MKTTFGRPVLTALLLLGAIPAGAATVTVAEETGSWVLRVDGQPFTVKGIAYTPEKVGEDPGLGTLRNWQYVDDNRNGVLDSPYEAFVDLNGDDQQDAAEPAIGDWALLRDMGVNTIRLYHHPSNDASVQAGYGGKTSLLKQFNHAPEKASLRDLHDRFGIYVAMGDFLGAYTIGSGAATTTDYNDATQRARMLASVRQMVMDYKDESFLLMYVLGNENNMSSLTQTNAASNINAYASMVEEAAQLIKSLDPNHPVAVSVGEGSVGAPTDTTLDTVVTALMNNAPSIDIIGGNIYRSNADSPPASYTGATTFFTDVQGIWDKPAMLTEFGDPRANITGGVLNESQQTAVLSGVWTAITSNAGASGAGNAIGGMAFEWLDNWWQNGAPSAHTTVTAGQFQNEWHGFASQGSGFRSPFLRRLRQVYGAFQALWGTSGRTVPAAGGRFLFPFGSSYAFLDVPDNALPAGTVVTLASTGSFPSAPGNTLSFTPTGTGVQVTTSNGAQPTKNLTIYVPFAHGGSAYVLARYDADHDKWVTLTTRRDAAGTLIAQTDHLSLFQVMQVTPAATTANAVAFPNPARPARGQSTITFAPVPSGSRVQIFTSSGELVRELNADVAGVALWDLNNRDGHAAASGVYFAIVDGPGGQEKIKVAVQR